MCGRFTRQYTWQEIWELYELTSPVSNLQPRYNICPTTTVDAVVAHELVPLRWGLVPSWWSKPLKEMKLATFNARAERRDVVGTRMTVGLTKHHVDEID